MKNLLHRKKSIKNSQPKKKPVKELPVGWFNVAYHGHHVIMNHRPVWNRKASDIVGSRLREVIVEKVADNYELPTIEEIKKELRNDPIKSEIENLFEQKLQREMNEVDYEVGLALAFNFIAEPRKTNLGTLPELAKEGLVSGGEIIERFYSSI